MKIKKYIRVLILGLVTLALSSCAYLPVDKLMKPPKLTNEQSELYNALERSVGITSLKLKYPKSGDNRSAFVYNDLDGDGKDEAIAFYQTENSSTVRINILEQEGDGWFSRDDVAGQGTDVDFIDFIDFGFGRKNMVVGWENRLELLSHVSVFDYEDREIREIFSEDYTNKVIDDLDGDGNKELLLLIYGRSYANADAMLIGRYQDKVDIVSQFHLIDTISEINKVTLGKTLSGEYGVFIDETIERRFYTTEAIGVRGDRLVSLMDEKYKDFRPNEDGERLGIFREERSVCRDMDGDGVIEIPKLSLLKPAGSHGAKGEKLYQTDFYDVLDEELEYHSSYFMNYDLGYAIKIPERWQGRVTTAVHSETNELRVLPLGKKTKQVSETAVPLLIVRAISQNDYRDKLDLDNFKLAGQKGIFEYYYSLPSNTIPGNNEDKLNLTDNELSEIFCILS